MDAMILAAGLGTRLRPLTDTCPKALVDVAGTPMLERVARRLVQAGATRLVVNLHPFAERVEDFVEERAGFGVEVVFSREIEAPLETGGGLFKARDLLRRDTPFFLHNVDVLTDLPLESLYARHVEEQPLATLAVMERETERYLLFDDLGLLGHAHRGKGIERRVRPTRGVVHELAFACVHVLSPILLDRITERGAFGIFDVYLRLAEEGMRILPFRADGCLWRDIGRPEQLEEARRLAGSL